MILSDWPINERPRERLIQYGAESLSDAELLAIILGKGTRGKNSVELSREILGKHKGLRGLLKCDLKAWSQTPGLGIAKFCQFQAALEIGRRYLAESLQRGQLIENDLVAKQFLLSQLRDQPKEVFVALFLDTKHRLIQYEVLSEGSIHQTMVYPRELVKRVLHHNAAAVIVAHNHPSGDPTPSKQDIAVTEQLTRALALIDTELLDHFVLGDGQVLSALKTFYSL